MNNSDKQTLTPELKCHIDNLTYLECAKQYQELTDEIDAGALTGDEYILELGYLSSRITQLLWG